MDEVGILLKITSEPAVYCEASSKAHPDQIVSGPRVFKVVDCLSPHSCWLVVTGVWAHSDRITS